LYFHFSSIFYSIKAKNKRIARLRNSFLTKKEGKSGKRRDNHQVSTEPNIATFFMRLFSSCCVLCDASVSSDISLCTPCLQDLPRIKSSCRQCGLPLKQQLEGALCGRCQQSLPPIDYLISSLHYAYPVGHLVAQLKFQHDLTLAKIFSHLLLTALTTHYKEHPIELPDLIIPVPLHKKRIRQRGFNQALEIARPIAKALNIPIAINTIQRIKHTQAQSLLSAKERRKNLRQSFALIKPLSARHIVLVDDVVTTGATVYELAILLKRSGVKKVGVWTVARAVKKQPNVNRT
jgi:ComF family protein